MLRRAHAEFKTGAEEAAIMGSGVPALQERTEWDAGAGENLVGVWVEFLSKLVVGLLNLGV
jgi:hypothetical protein